MALIAGWVNNDSLVILSCTKYSQFIYTLLHTSTWQTFDVFLCRMYQMNLFSRNIKSILHLGYRVVGKGVPSATVGRFSHWFLNSNGDPSARIGGSGNNTTAVNVKQLHSWQKHLHGVCSYK